MSTVRWLWVGILTIGIAGTGLAADWYHGGWNYRMPITVDHTKVFGSLTNYPLLIVLTNNNFRHADQGGHMAKTNAGDLIVTTADNLTRLPHEIERYTPANGELVAWVNVAELSAASDTRVNLYYGNQRSGDMAAVTSVWDYASIRTYHMAEPSGDFSDSTRYNSNGVPSGDYTQDIPGRIGQGCRLFGGSINLGSMNLAKSWTMEGWFNPDLAGDGVHHGMIGNGSVFRVYLRNTDGIIRCRYLQSGATYVDYLAGLTVTASNWFHFAITYDGTTLSGYRNGFLNAPLATGTNINGGVVIGGAFSYGTFTGKVDEIRFSTTPRSAEWIRTSYTNQFNPSGFYTAGAEEALPSGTLFFSR